MKKTFEAWMILVNDAIWAKAGCFADDLPDVCYRDWYDDGMSPKAAASRAIKSAKE